MNPQRPNVLCFVTDQQRRDHVGCAGNAHISTPNIDRLAASGVRFDRCYVNNPICSPSRATMWTGLSVRGHRVRANGMSLDRTIPTVPGALAAVGYRTHGVGKFHLTPFHWVASQRPGLGVPSAPCWRAAISSCASTLLSTTTTMPLDCVCGLW